MNLPVPACRVRAECADLPHKPLGDFLHALDLRRVAVERALGFRLLNYLAILLARLLHERLFRHQTGHVLRALHAHRAGLRGVDPRAASQGQRGDQTGAAQHAADHGLIFHGHFSSPKRNDLDLAAADGEGGPSAHAPHCARWRSAWSINTSANRASTMGVARMPTQGS